LERKKRKNGLEMQRFPATEWEYKTLRDEILQHQRISVQILAMSIAATGIILGISVPSKDSYLSLIPLIVLIPAIYIYISFINTIFRLAAYISMFIETNTEGLQYETLWAERKMASRIKIGPYGANALVILHGLASICLIISFVYWSGALTPLLAIVCLLIVIVIHSTLLMNRITNPQWQRAQWQRAQWQKVLRNMRDGGKSLGRR